MSVLIVNRPGFQTLLQDQGRQGSQRAGLTEGGAADQHAYRWANKLLDNGNNAACLEILMGQFDATVTDDVLIAVTGADLAFTINGKAAENWSSHWLQAGDKIAFNRPLSGLRAYLAVAGGWQTPQCFGSRSVVIREHLGGLDGGPIKAGDRLVFNEQQRQAQRQLAPQYIPDYQADLTLQVVPGYQYAEFSGLDRRRFTSSRYTISNQIDRMGYRLKGPIIVPKIDGVISEGIAMGAVQVPRDGQPIVLLRDRQTIGGYPKIGCVSSLCCSKLSQRGPGAQVTFEFAELADLQ
ncbi:MAG: biotin-dependent carboxyltransferase family protein, partial [Natronospirillum sp.]